MTVVVVTMIDDHGRLLLSSFVIIAVDVEEAMHGVGADELGF